MEQILTLINTVISIVFTICYLYQFIYIPLPWILPKKKLKEPEKLNDYAVLICARNEEVVVSDLIESLKAQTYDQEHLHIFVMADNCTDHTAEYAEKAGAHVYTRNNTTQVGKGYALKLLLQNLKKDYPDGFDGYFVFDADNLLKENYIEEMHRTFSNGHDIITSYRNSKNYGYNWITAGYALWFLRESRYLNHPRYLLGTSCAVSGTGFMFSRKVAEEIGDWPFHMLTEDIEFSVNQIVGKRKIAFCPDAELYDEQPTTFAQSWRQRMRWAKGYIQVFQGYGKDLVKGTFSGNFGCYDMAMAIMPAFILSAISIICNLVMCIYGIFKDANPITFFTSILSFLFGIYSLLFVVGVITTISEWKHIKTTAFRKILFCFTFPVFMFTYIPISIAALFHNPGWKPIEHTVSVASLREMEEKQKNKNKK